MPIKNDKNKEIIPTKGLWAGDPSAPVSLVLFGDYESEECGKAHRVITKLLESHGKKIRFNYRHFPLTQIHQHSHKAAEAAVAAAQEGKFWEMHNLLFAHHRRLGTISLREYARWKANTAGRLERICWKDWIRAFATYLPYLLMTRYITENLRNQN
jgi:protein-disulfide isomerase